MFEFLKPRRKVYFDTEPSRGNCVDCKFSVSEKSRFNKHETVLLCQHPRNYRDHFDPVTGKTMKRYSLLESCVSQRMGSMTICINGMGRQVKQEYDPKWRCGKHGGWFEPKGVEGVDERLKDDCSDNE